MGIRAKPDVDAKYLVTLNLKYGSEAKPLKVLAFAQLAAKAIFYSKGSLGLEELSRSIAKLVGIPRVSEALVKGGLKYLEDIGKVVFRNEKWSLKDLAAKEIKSELEHSRNQARTILGSHFPKTIDSRKLYEWFASATADFFGYFGEEWVSASCRGGAYKNFRSRSIADLLITSIDKYNFSNYKEQLIDGFISFISSNDVEDQHYLMSLGMAMFSAKLVAADVGVDPLAVDELKNSRLLLDTNILFALSLDGHKASKALQRMGKALKTLGIQVSYLNTTKEEYKRVINAKKGEVMHLLSQYVEEIVGEAGDQFLETAKLRGCMTRDDYERFFDSLKSIPSEISKGVSLKMEDYREIEEIVVKSSKNADLKEEIQTYYKKFRKPWRAKERSEAALNHDSAIIMVADYLRATGEKCWILSLDRAIQASASSRAEVHVSPVVISIDALVGILAVNNAGPDVPYDNFAPLLANIILNKCLPSNHSYTVHDLHWLLRVNQQATGLMPNDVKTLLNDIAKARYEGRSEDSSALQLKINRAFEEKKISYDQKLAEAHEKIVASQTEENLTKSKLEQAGKRIEKFETDEKRRKARIWLVRQLLWRIPVSCAVPLMLFFIYKTYFDGPIDRDVISFLFEVISFVLIGFGLLRDIVDKYKKKADG